MTEPDPGTLTVSRRALRGAAGQAVAAGDQHPAETTRRSLRPATAQDEQSPIVFAGRVRKSPPSAAEPQARSALVELPVRMSVPPAEPAAPESVATLEPVLVLEPLASPIWAAMTDAAAHQPAPESRPLPGDAETPLWAAIRSHSASLPAPYADPGQPAAEPPPTAAGRSAPTPAPAIFKPPPPPEPVRYVPLLAGADAASRPVRHARRRIRPIRLGLAAAAVAAVLVGGSAAMTAAAMTGAPIPIVAADLALAPTPTAAAPGFLQPPIAPPLPIVASASAVQPTAPSTAQAAALDLCAIPGVQAALASGDDAAALIAAAGGGDAFRAAVAGGAASCVDLRAPSHTWVVIDKTRPLDPIDFAPADLNRPDPVRTLEDGVLRADASTAMAAMVGAAARAGVGEIAVLSAYRSYATQVSSFGTQVSDRGTDAAELVSARPGYSEHQSGLAADVVACDGACGTLDQLAATPQGEWVAAHSWEYGWIVRYESGHTDVTGYSPEPWHLRYIGVDLATTYHDGGWHTLEEFFGLPASPDYAG